MTKEEAWLVWMKYMKTTNTPIETDFDVIKKTSWWEAFEAGWNLASVNLNGWDQAYAMGLEAGKREWVGLADVEVAGLTCECVDDGTFNMNCAHDFARASENALKEKNT